jgi:hypothetical protein
MMGRPVATNGDPFQDDLFIAPGDEGLAEQMREVSQLCPMPRLPTACVCARERKTDRSAELGHGHKTPSEPSVTVGGIADGRH